MGVRGERNLWKTTIKKNKLYKKICEK